MQLLKAKGNRNGKNNDDEKMPVETEKSQCSRQQGHWVVSVVVVEAEKETNCDKISPDIRTEESQKRFSVIAVKLNKAKVSLTLKSCRYYETEEET